MLSANKKYENHVDELCRLNNIQYHYLNPKVGDEATHSHPNTREICGQRVKNAKQYAIAMHEIGHVMSNHTEPMVRVFAQKGREGVLEKEREAWAWAREHAIAWTPEMQRLQEFALNSYEQNLPPTGPQGTVEMLLALAERGMLR